MSHLIATRFFFLSEQSALNSLEVEVTYNPLYLKSNLYKYLKSMLYRPLHRQQPQPRDQRAERHQPKQVRPSSLTNIDRHYLVLLICFLQKGRGQFPDTLMGQGGQHMTGAAFTYSCRSREVSIACAVEEIGAEHLTHANTMRQHAVKRWTS